MAGPRPAISYADGIGAGRPGSIAGRLPDFTAAASGLRSAA